MTPVAVWQKAGCGGEGHQHSLACRPPAPGAQAPASAAPAKASFQTLRSRQLDHDDLKEGCACCQGGVPDGPDELAGALGITQHSHGHTHWSVHVPNTIGQIGTAAVMGGFGLIGLYAGGRNFRQAEATMHALTNDQDGKIPQTDQKLRRAEADLQRATRSISQARGTANLPLAPAHKLARLERQRVKNTLALRDNLSASLTMQYFIHFFDGIMPILSSLLVMGGIFMPLLAAIGTGMQCIYCAGHVARYLGWDLKRTTDKVVLKDWAASLELVTSGKEVFAKFQKHRANVFKKTSAAFFAYGVGAGLLALHAGLGVSLLLIPGGVLFVVGLGLVLKLNNGPIIKTFFNSREAHLEREHLGTKEAQLRYLATFDAERKRAESMLAVLREEKLVSGAWVDWALAWSPYLQSMPRRKHLECNAQDESQVTREQQRRRRLVGFVYESAQANRSLVHEELASIHKQKSDYAEKHGAEDSSIPAVKATLAGLSQRAADIETQLSCIEGSLLPAAQKANEAAAAGNNLTDEAMFSLIWRHLASLKTATGDAHEHLDRIVAKLAEEHQEGSWWQKFNEGGQGSRLDPNSLLKMSQIVNSNADACIKTFCQLAQEYMIYGYRDILDQQMGSLVDHLAARIHRAHEPAPQA